MILFPYFESVCIQLLLIYLSFLFLKRLCLSLLGRLAGSDRDRLWKQAEMAAPEDSPDGREEMEVALQQVGLMLLY